MTRTRTKRVSRAAWVGLAGAAMALVPALGAGSAGASTSSTLKQVKTELLKLSDVPKGWTSTANTSSNGGSFPGESQLASCIGVPESVLNLNPPSVNSPEFDNKGGTQTVDESVAVFTSKKVGQRQLAALANSKTPGCYQTLLNGTLKSQFTSSFGSGASVGTITVSSGSPVSGSKGLNLGFTVNEQGVTVPVKLTMVFALKNTKGIELSFTGVGQAFPASLEKSLTSTAMNRVK